MATESADFVTLCADIRAQERELCAKIAEDPNVREDFHNLSQLSTAGEWMDSLRSAIAQAIRKRSA